MFQVRDGVMRALLRLSIGTNLPIALFALLAAVILVALGATSLVAFTDSLDQGLITQEQFAEKRQEVLNRM